jgi:hypothetical protein
MGLGDRTYNSLRSITPRPLRKPLGAAIEGIGQYTSFLRLLPSFIIVGGQRCGTNSLYEYLVGHSCIARALPLQEVHYFDFNFDKGAAWYRGHFPSVVRPAVTRLRHNSRFITGECSPYYMFHPHCPRRIIEMLPDVKLFVLLRNPVDRAYSHYQHEHSHGIETLSFEDAINEEPNRLEGELERMLEDPTYYSFNHHHFSYLSRGLYIDQLETLFSVTPNENIKVLISEEFFADPASAHADALESLGLPPEPLATYPAYNPGRYSGMEPALRSRLIDHFAGANERLYGFLETDFRWV